MSKAHPKPPKPTAEQRAEEHPDAPALRTIAREGRDLVSLALRAVECGAFPGPDWRRRAKEYVQLVDSIQDVPRV